MLQLKVKLRKVSERLKVRGFKKKLACGGALFIALILVYLAISLIKVRPAEIKLARLKNSWEKERMCHEACSLKRREITEAVINSLEKERIGAKSRLRRRLELYFLDDKISLEFKLELIRIIRQADGPDNPPGYLKNYLSSANGEGVIQGEIISSFSVGSLAPEFIGQSPLDYYYLLLAEDRQFAVKEAIIRILSNYPNKNSDFSSGQVAIIKNLVLNPAADNRLRQSLVLLLDDYYPLFPDPVADVLAMIYKTKTFNDKISRFFAADILSRNDKKNKWPLPNLSTADWDEYYNN